MTYKELNWYFKRILHKEEPFELINGYPRSKGGNMCYLCSKTDTCKYVLTGDLYFGQTVGPSADGNDFVYECPKFEYQENIWCRNDEINNDPLRGYYKWQVKENPIDVFYDIAESIKELDNEAKMHPIYKKYSK